MRCVDRQTNTLPTDRPTDRPTNRPTASYRYWGALLHLKSNTYPTFFETRLRSPLTLFKVKVDLPIYQCTPVRGTNWLKPTNTWTDNYTDKLEVSLAARSSQYCAIWRHEKNFHLKINANLKDVKLDEILVWALRPLPRHITTPPTHTLPLPTRITTPAQPPATNCWQCIWPC